MNQIEKLIHQTSWDSIKPLLKELQPKTNEQSELEKVLAIAKDKFKVGDIVAVKYTSYIARVHGYNECVGGFYPGVRSPVLVKIIHNDADSKRFNDVPGSVFEYGLDQLEHTTLKYYKINAGYAALDNGSVAPLPKLFDIAFLADQPVITGHGYGDDYLFVPRNAEKKQAIEDLLTGENLIWEIVDTLPKHIQLHK